MDRIHVSVRARPLSAEDAKTSPWRISGNSILIPNLHSKFDFDQIFGADCRTLDVYRARTRDIVASAVDGFNGTVFAYGQTSSGKTHTMRGSNSEPGVIPLAVHDLFNIIQQEMDREFLLRMSYMEIYNEEINDLLAPEHRKLQIHESIERGIYVAGLREEIVASADQVLERMDFGESHRHIGETNMNLYSSRSHTIFRMIIESREKSDDAEADMSGDAVRVSVLNLVDLAGSERAAKTGAEGVRLKEGSHINKSLMTLGTVIKKLSEGAESQGGHVPYRDSKLTRILQPALGGNANTAIICNITLAQIHADETKSSLQFASRALRVTNHAHVNEVMTDAALLKRQKKEIEELRAKLQGLHSEHPEEDILDLRNTLLKSELERERMALELEEEKRAQAEREKRLQEQAKRIENLSSMVLCANREETSEVYKKAKRRDTWCPGKLARENLQLSSVVEEKATEVKSTRANRKKLPLVHFEDLAEEPNTFEVCSQDKDYKKSEPDDCTLPDPCALLHVTSRKKVPSRKKSLPTESNDLAEMQAQYENLVLEFETHRTLSDAQIDYLTRRLAEADHVSEEKCRECDARDTKAVAHPNENKSLRDSDAILVIRQLQEKIAVLEMEKSSSEQNLDCVVDLATEQTISAQEKYDKLYEELLLAREEATLARDKLASAHCSMEESDWLTSLSKEAQELELEFEQSRHLFGSISSVLDELLQFSSVTSSTILNLRPSASEISLQMRSVIKSREKEVSCLRNKISELEDEKHILNNQASELRTTLEELSLEVQSSANAAMELSEMHEMETSELLSQIKMLQRELSSFSSCSLAKEKETIRKDLEKTKLKLKDTESKLKNAIQEKTKLEGEKSCSERELKRLQNQKTMLERDMNKHESLIGRRRDSIIDRGSNVFDQRRVKSSTASAEMAEEYRKLEVLAFEMETTIGSLEEQLAMSNMEKDEALSRAESLASDLQALSDELHASNSELSTLEEEVQVLRTSLEESKSRGQKIETSLNSLTEENEELSMHLADALLTMEEEKAIWSSKEKSTMKAIEEKEKIYNREISVLSKALSEARNELEICRTNCKDLEQRLTSLQEQADSYKQFSGNSSQNLSTDGQRSSDDHENRSPEALNAQLDSKSQKAFEEIESLKLELRVLEKDKQYLLSQVQELNKELAQVQEVQVLELKYELEQQRARLASLEGEMCNDKVTNSKTMAKLKMRLHGSQAKLESFRVRYTESVDELAFMRKKYEEGSSNLKKQLADFGCQILRLTKELANRGQ